MGNKENLIKCLKLIVSFVVLVFYIINFVLFKLPILLFNTEAFLTGLSDGSIAMNLPSLDSMDALKNIFKIALVAIASILIFKIANTISKLIEVKDIFQFRNNEEGSDEVQINYEFIDTHNPFLYSCKVMSLRN